MAADTSEVTPDVMTAETFQPLLGRTFTVRGGRHAVELAEVEVGAAQLGWDLRPFTRILRGAPGEVLAEGQHVLDTEGGDGFALYLIPIHTPARDRQDYQAVFA
jgi:hypothetical protein